jgi:hypothetical protein
LDEGLAYVNTLWEQREVHKAFTKQFFGHEGLNAPGTCTIDGNLLPGWTAYSMSQTTGAWLAQHFWLHWKFSADREFLEQKAYPYVRDVALFLEQQTYLDGGVRLLEYSSSPEINDNRLESWFSDFTNFDLALMRFIFDAAVEMSDSLGLEDDHKHWSLLRTQVPCFACEEDGALMFSPSMPYNQSHRHFSHAMAIFPLCIIDANSSPLNRKIVDATIQKLYDMGPDYWCGYSYSWLANLEARAGHGEKASEALRTFAECFCLRNSFHANGDQTKSGKSKFTYRPFTLEGNFAFASGVHEMLLQSYPGPTRIFPAIPDNWKVVSFDRLRAVGGFLVSAHRVGGKVTFLRVFSEKGGCFTYIHPETGETCSVEMQPNQAVDLI